jgi:hypothetical protein
MHHRAYIAASRRSDRSIEARLESAKRASEVHKKRTGRALRVTQEDVENEEMYEEEDGDLQMNFRNLAAQWYANSPEFNRKLHAYLASQSAMQQNLPNSFVGNQYGNSTSNQYTGNPFLAQLVQQRLPQQSQPQSPQSQQSQPQFKSPQSPGQTGHINFPTSYRQSPYSIPGHGPRRPSEQSIQQSAHEAIAALASRRNSMPAHAHAHGGTMMSPNAYTGTPMPEPPPMIPDSHHSKDTPSSASQPTTPQTAVQSPADQTARPSMPSRQSSHSHSYSMPAVQPFPGQTLPNSQAPEYQDMFATGGGMRQTPFYSYNPNLPRESPQRGMEQTLSPDALTVAPTAPASDEFVTSATSEFFPTDLDGMPSGALDFNWQFGDGLQTPGSVTDPSFPPDEWASFLNADALDDTSS